MHKKNILILSREPNFFSSLNTYSLTRHKDYYKILDSIYPGSEIDIISPKKNKKKDFEYKNLNIFGYKDKNKYFYFFNAIKIFFFKIYKKKKIHVVTTQFPYYTLLGLIIKLLTGAKLSVQIPFNCFSIDWIKERFFNIFILIFGLVILIFADKIQVLSRSQEILLRKIYKFKNIKTIPIPGQKLEYKKKYSKKIKNKFKNIFSKNYINILFVGRFSKQKNLELWLKIADNVLNDEDLKKLKIKFFIVGDGPEKINVKKIINSSNVKKNIHLVRWLSKSEIEYFYRYSDIYLLTSNYEATPRCVQEAHRMRLPVVSTLSTGTEDVILNGKSGYLTKIKDELSLIKKLKKLIKDNKLRSQMSLNAYRQYKKNFDYDILAKKKILFWFS